MYTIFLIGFGFMIGYTIAKISQILSDSIIESSLDSDYESMNDSIKK